MPGFSVGEVKLLNTNYAENITVKMLVKNDFCAPLIEKLTDITNGTSGKSDAIVAHLNIVSAYIYNFRGKKTSF